jgi:hypothetical protein
MNPKIVFPEGYKDKAYLVDLNSVIRQPTSDGKIQHVPLLAIYIGHLKAGEIEKIDDYYHPKICVPYLDSLENNRSPLFRGIYPDAAKAMLSISSPIKTSIIQAKKLEIDGTSKNNEWHLFIAWCWSRWQEKHRGGDRWTLERRWEDMRSRGYKGEFACFRQLCSRMKLSVTKSGPYM